MSGTTLSVVEATRRRLGELDKKMPGLAAHPWAATALVLAKEIDGKNSLTSKQMAAGRMVDIFEKLEARVPPEKPEDEVSRLARGA